MSIPSYIKQKTTRNLGILISNRLSFLLLRTGLFPNFVIKFWFYNDIAIKHPFIYSTQDERMIENSTKSTKICKRKAESTFHNFLEENPRIKRKF